MLIIHALDAEKSTGKSKHTNNRQRGIMMFQTMSMSSPKPALKPANVGNWCCCFLRIDQSMPFSCWTTLSPIHTQNVDVNPKCSNDPPDNWSYCLFRWEKWSMLVGSLMTMSSFIGEGWGNIYIKPWCVPRKKGVPFQFSNFGKNYRFKIERQQEPTGNHDNCEHLKV